MIEALLLSLLFTAVTFAVGAFLWHRFRRAKIAIQGIMVLFPALLVIFSLYALIVLAIALEPLALLYLVFIPMFFWQTWFACVMLRKTLAEE